MSLWRYRPRPEDWRVWQRLQPPVDQNDGPDGRAPWQVGAMVALGLGCALLALVAVVQGLLALLSDRPAPATILLLGHAPLWIWLIATAGRETPKLAEESQRASFFGYLTERGLRLNEGPLIGWGDIRRYELGWSVGRTISLRLHLSEKRTTRTPLSERLRFLVLPLGGLLAASLGPLATVAALLLALRLPGAQAGLKSAVCATGAHLAFLLIVLFGILTHRAGRARPDAKSLELLFDASQVSPDELTARLDRHLES